MASQHPIEGVNIYGSMNTKLNSCWTFLCNFHAHFPKHQILTHFMEKSAG